MGPAGRFAAGRINETNYTSNCFCLYYYGCLLYPPTHSGPVRLLLLLSIFSESPPFLLVIIFRYFSIAHSDVLPRIHRRRRVFFIKCEYVVASRRVAMTDGRMDYYSTLYAALLVDGEMCV